MERTFQAANIECNGCANTVKAALLDDFGEVKVDVAKKEVTLELGSPSDEKKFKEIMADIGFDVTKEI
ncbi:MAG: heavy-metal-associated domain-containing protein [Helicobacteraceae bacterium]